MHDGTKCEQLTLFRKRLAWQELPGETRDRTIDLVTSLCIEIVTEQPPVTQEQDNEPAGD